MPKKKSTKKPSVKVNDLRAKKSPKGGKATFHDLSFTHKVDKASPILTSTTSTSTDLKISSADALKIK